MIITKENRKAIYQNLFKEGVMVAKKDYNAPSHPDVPGVRNLEVIKALQSLESRGLVKSQFTWQYYYYFLTDEGILYLREYLHLPAQIVPETFKKSANSTGQRPGQQQERRTKDSGNTDYRYAAAGDQQKEVAPGSFKPEFK